MSTHQENIQKVVGTVVRIWNPKRGAWSVKTARIKGYHSPLVWELDRLVFGTQFHADEAVQTFDGKRLAELIH